MLVPALILVCAAAAASAQQLRTGVGIYDVTGPASEVPFMGYAFPNQTGHGIHFRLFSRAFVFVDSNDNRVVYIQNDICMGFMGLKFKVIDTLKTMYGDLYDHHNVILGGTHTHSGPGALSWFLLYDISMLGINQKHFDAVAHGIVQAIVNAHNNVGAAGPIYLTQGMLYNASANRSPSSYLANPVAERAMYEQWGGDTDKNMTVLHIRNASAAIGMISFFAVHGTSMHNSNRLVSGDNKGAAAAMFEHAMNGNETLTGKGAFVAAFGQSNEGDVTPNTLGAWCYGRVGGVYCGDNRSLCEGKNEYCFSVGPMGFKDDFGSCKYIADKQYRKARELFDAAPTSGKAIQGQVKTVFKWVNMSNVTVSAEFTSTGDVGHTCRPAVGDSFAAGTTDGPGAFNFYQGDNCSTCLPFWNFIKNFLKRPTKEQIACQFPKPILLDVGEITPHPWVPSVLPLQISQIGSFVIIAVPAEFTTMAGRRLRNTVQAVFASHGQDVTVVISGLTNGYTQYVATYEEYQYQRYEAGSTLYGPHTLSAYQQEFAALAEALATNTPVDPGQPAQNQSYVNFDLQPGVIQDTTPPGTTFGTVAADRPKDTFTRGAAFNVSFWGASLRNDYLQGGSFMTVDRSVGSTWVTIQDDSSWDTKLYWLKVNKTMSYITTEWTIPEWVQPGTYRMTLRGYAKPSSISSKIEQYFGASKPFAVTA